MSVHFEVADQGAPNLAGDGEQPPPPDGFPSQPESPYVAEIVWTPEEAQGVLQTVMNFGVFFYGRDWLCGPGDFLRSSPNAARLLERVFPKATTGGPIGLGIDVAAVASDFGVSVADRRHLLKKGPKQAKQIAQEFGFGNEQPQQVPPDIVPSSPLPPDPEPAPSEQSSFKFSPQVAAALGRASAGNVDLGGFGLS